MGKLHEELDGTMSHGMVVLWLWFNDYLYLLAHGPCASVPYKSLSSPYMIHCMCLCVYMAVLCKLLQRSQSCWQISALVTLPLPCKAPMFALTGVQASVEHAKQMRYCGRGDCIVALHRIGNASVIKIVDIK